MAKLGLLPQIEGRLKASTTIWLDLTLKTGAQPLEGEKFQAGDAELEFRPCPVPQGGGTEDAERRTRLTGRGCTARIAGIRLRLAPRRPPKIAARSRPA